MLVDGLGGFGLLHRVEYRGENGKAKR
jgi:hypothetical protein